MLISRFLMIGVYNTIIGYIIFIFLSLLFKKFHYIVILIISYIISVSHAYLMQRIFVFKSENAIFSEYWRFFIVNLTGLAINAIFLSFLIEIGLAIKLSQAIALFLTTIVSYFGHKNFSFTK